MYDFTFTAVSRPTLTPSSLEPHFSAPPSSPPSIPSKPTTLPPTPQEPKPRYPPDTISNLPTTLPVVSKEKESRHISDPSSMSEKKSSKLDPLPGKTELPVERKSSSSVPRSRAPTFDDLDPPPDDLPPPDGYPAKTPLFIVLDDIPPPDDEIPPPDDDLLPPPDDDLPPPNDDFPNPEEGPPLDDLPSSPMDELPPPDDLEPPPSDFLHSTPPIQKVCQFFIIEFIPRRFLRYQLLLQDLLLPQK